MSVEGNLRVIEQWVEAYNAHDFESFAKPFTEAAEYYDPSQEDPLKGPEEIREYFAPHPASFPDTRITIERSFGQADMVCGEFTWTATLKGPLPGTGGEMIPATNKSVRLPMAVIFRFDRGKIAEAREYYDQVAINTQLGLPP